MNINNTLKNIIKKLMKVVLILLILIGTGLAGYASWFSIEKEKKITFFTEETPNFFKDIEWSPTRNFWQSLSYGNLDRYGEDQEGYDSKGRLVIRHVLMNEDIPVVAYYFSGGDDLNVQSTIWIIDCKPGLKLEEELICWKNGKFVNNMRSWNYFTSGKISMSGFSYRSQTYEIDRKKLERNKKLKGSFSDGRYYY